MVDKMDKVLINRIEQLTVGLNEESSNEKWIFLYKQIQSVLQKGPQCGIVALCMALNYKDLKCTPDELMAIARSSNYTISGELFDIESLYQLAKPYYDQCEVIHLEKQHKNDEFVLSVNKRLLIEHLLNGRLILVPYDCDLNFEPCFKNGKKAHWALIHGFIYSTKNTNGLIDEYCSNCYKLNDGHDYEHCMDSLDFDKFYVFAKHGKSTYTAIWSLKKLLLSNGQLNEIDDKRTSTDEYLIPSSGISQTLSSKVLVIL